MKTSLRLHFFAGLCCLWFSSQAFAQSALQDSPPMPEQLRVELLDGKLDAALRTLDDLQKNHPDATGFWYYLEGIAQQRMGQGTAAIAAFERVEKDFTAGPWVHKARFHHAEVLSTAGDWKGAEQIWESEVSWLRGAERQRELAAIYFDLADGFSAQQTGAASLETVEYQSAIVLYQKGLELDIPADQRQYALGRVAWCYAELKDWGRAAGAYESLLKEFPDHQVQYAYAQALRQHGSLEEARRVYENLAVDLTDLREDPALDQLHGLALYALGFTYGDYSSDRKRAIGAFRRFLAAHPQHMKAPRAAFGIAKLRVANGEIAEAIAAFQSFLEMPVLASDNLEALEQHVSLRQKAHFELAQAYISSGDYALGGAAFARYVSLFPEGEDWAASQAGILDAEYSLGRLWETEQKWEAARAAYVQFLAAHPLDNRVREILYRIGDLQQQQGSAVEGEVRADFYRSAIADWSRLIAKYPTSEEASHALFSTGYYRELELDDLEGAVESYRGCNFGQYASGARDRLAAMVQPRLAIHTKRVWRSNDTANFELDLRNIKAVTVEIYRLDLEAYFRKHLSDRLIEDLDLDLIAADKEFEFNLEEFDRYRPYTRSVELPVEGVGVWAVVVSSKDKRATTLVMRSDIDIIVKSSREGALVFAEDMLHNKGAAGVELVIAVHRDGKEAPQMLEATTGRDGVAQIDFKEFDLSGVTDVRVFAQDKRGVATTKNWVANAQVVQSLEPSGFVFTDASAYQPGALVSWRAVLREVDEGVYTFKKGEKWRVTMTDGSGRAVYQEELALSDFGTMFGSTRLAAGAPSGIYAVNCESPSGRKHRANFVVRTFEVKRVEIDLEFDRPVYYRGEEINLTVRAKYSYGEPVANAVLRIDLPGSAAVMTHTDEKGEYHLVFPTRDFDTTGALSFVATLPQQNVDADGTRLLSATGFRVGITPPESVYLLGRSIPIELRTLRPDGVAMEQAMELRFLRRYQDARSRWIEEEVSRQSVTTDQQGAFTAQLMAQQGGQHVVIAEGTDRFGNPVSARVEFMVSGNDDSTKLRLLSDVANVSVGGKIPLEVVNRAGSGLALVTFEGGRILDYRLVSLQEGVQALDVDVPDKFFPDLMVTVNLMHENNFHSAERGFGVVRNLVVKMIPRKEVVHPGEVVEVDVEVRNHLGEPVSAELSFAAVDASLFEMFPDLSGNILSEFHGRGKRRNHFTTQASNVFNYVGVTREIAAALLAEDQRLKAEEAWVEGKDRATEKLRRAGEYTGPGDTIPPGTVKLGARSPQSARFAAPAEEMELEELGYAGEDEWNNNVGLGGGAGGRYGGRGGRGGGKGGNASKDGGISEAFGRSAVVGNALVGQVDEEMLDALTADWQPRIITDRKGHATITFTAPQLSTRWRLMCRGVDQGTAVGQGTASVISRADFLVELRTPSVLLEGDHAAVLARAHNLTGLAGDVTLAVTVNYPSGAQIVEATLHFDGSAVVDVPMDLPGLVPGGLSADVQVRLAAVGHFEANQGGEVFHVEASTARPVRVAPWGLAVAAQHSGQLLSSSDFTLQLPAGGNYSAAGWNLHIGLGLDQLLVEEALAGAAPYLQRGHVLRHDGPQRNPEFAGELLGVLGVLQHLRDTRRSDHPAYNALLNKANGLVTTLLATQQTDGGWAWSSRTHATQFEVSARVMIALESASTFGLNVPSQTLSSGRNHLTSSLSGTANQLPFSRAIVLYALSLSDHVDFGLANSLHRMRDRLSPAAAAYTALTLNRLDSKGMANDMLEIALRRDTKVPFDAISWCSSPVELQALLLTAALKISPTHSAIVELEQSLMEQRPWYGEGAHGMALAAISAHRTVSGLLDREAEVTVTVANGQPQTFQLGAHNTSVDLQGLVAQVAGQHAVHMQLQLKGRGKPHFTATLEGFDTQPKENQGKILRVWRTYLLASPAVYNGQEIQSGFTTVDSTVRQWQNEITQLEFGNSAPMHIVIAREYNNAEEAKAQDFISVEIPLPAGTHVVENSVSGSVESWKEQDGRLYVDVSGTNGSAYTIDFRLRGLVPGKYRLLPVTVRSAYDPSVFGVGHFGALEVLPRGVASSDSYRATPDELYKLGLAEYQRKDFDLAWEHMRILEDQFGDNLNRSALLESSRISLELAIDRNDANRIVKFFEILKEKNPTLTVSFARMAVIAAAYRDLGEYERAARVLSAIAEETFSLDLQVVRVLEEQNDFHAATESLHRFWLAYPDFPAVVETALTLADRLMMAAPQAHSDRSLRLAQRDRAVLLYESVMLLQRFLGLYADNPIAPDAALNLISANLDLEDYQNASRLAAEFAARYKQPSFNDAFVYTQAVAEWTMGNDKQSTKLLQGIADTVYTDDFGHETYSENRNLALYILAQIHHAKRDFVNAASYYAQVQTVFADAALVLEGFRRRALTVDEVTEVSPGDKAKLELHYRNIDRAELLVYPVDLMTLYLREKNLAGITSVNLAGIEPVIRRSVKLPDNGSMRQQDFEVELKLPEAGAYLVICRSEAMHASGMVLVSDFELEVAQISGNSVRVQAVDRKEGSYLRDVDVRVIGAMDNNFISGRTDPRGLYLADGFHGAATVIARHGGRHYAFYRGTIQGAGLLLDSEFAPSQDDKRMQQDLLDSNSYLDNVRGFNGLQQETRSQNLQEKQKSPSLGVELNKLQ